MAAVLAKGKTRDFAMFGQAGGINNEVHLGMLFVALPETNGVVDKIDARATFGDFVGANHFVEMHPHFGRRDRKSTRLNSSHVSISYAVFCLKKKKLLPQNPTPALLLPASTCRHLRRPSPHPASHRTRLIIASMRHVFLSSTLPSVASRTLTR